MTWTAEERRDYMRIYYKKHSKKILAQQKVAKLKSDGVLPADEPEGGGYYDRNFKAGLTLLDAARLGNGKNKRRREAVNKYDLGRQPAEKFIKSVERWSRYELWIV